MRGKRSKALAWTEVYSRSGLGTTYGADRWKTVTWPASGWMPGTNWMALAPVPSTAIRLPRRSTSWSHSAEWKAGPSKVPRPGSSGIAGRESCPTAVTRTSVSIRSPVDVVRCQERARSSYVAEVTSTPVRTRSSTPCSRAVRSM